jgi:hypothetical protein
MEVTFLWTISISVRETKTVRRWLGQGEGADMLKELIVPRAKGVKDKPSTAKFGQE